MELFFFHFHSYYKLEDGIKFVKLWFTYIIWIILIIFLVAECDN